MQQEPTSGGTTGRIRRVDRFATGSQQPVTGQQAGYIDAVAPGPIPPPPGYSAGMPYAPPQGAMPYQPAPAQSRTRFVSAQSSMDMYRFSPQRPQNTSRQPSRWRLVLRRLILLLALIGIIIGAVVGLSRLTEGNRLREALTPYNAVFCEGVYVDGIHLGGMSQQEARQAVTEQAMNRVNWHVSLTMGGEILGEVTAADVGFAADVESALKSAWAEGHTGSEQERYDAMADLRENNFHAYSITAGSDTSVIDNLLDRIRLSLYVAPKEAQMIGFDPDRTYPFLFSEEVVGRSVDMQPVKEQIYRMLSDMESGEIVLEPTYIYPTQTVAWLQSNLYTARGTSSTRISSTSTENRTNNIRRCFELISGTVIEPGKSFSFNDIVGQRTVQNGFFEADEYVYETVQTGVGGGACQASTTVYQAAVYAGMDITERRPHSMSVGYTEKGKDATVYWYSNHRIDLKFRNNTQYPVYITAAVQSKSGGGSQLYANVTVWGQSLGNITYDIDVETVEIPAPEEPEIIKDKKGEYVLYTDEEYIAREASAGYIVDSYRVTRVDGAMVDRSFLFEDTYKAKAQQIYVGVQTPPPVEEELLQ